MLIDPQVSPEDIARFTRAFHFKSDPAKNTYLEQLLKVDHPQQKFIRSYAIQQFPPNYINKKPALKNLIREILPTIEGSEAWLVAVDNLNLRNEAPLVLEQFLSGEDHMSKKAGEILFKMNQDRLIEGAFIKALQVEKNDYVDKLSRVSHGGANRLLRSWIEKGNLKPQLEIQIVNAIGNDINGQRMLLKMLQSGKLRDHLTTSAAIKVAGSWDQNVRKEAPKFLAEVKSKRGKPLPTIKELLRKTGHVELGKEVFGTYCASCHQVDGEGIVFGPDLSEIGDKLPKSALYNAIIYPSAGINFGYEGYLLTMKDETIYNGYIISETENQINLKVMGGVDQTIDRSQIVDQKAMENSLMTAGLHEVMEENELINLVEYLSTLRNETIETTD